MLNIIYRILLNILLPISVIVMMCSDDLYAHSTKQGASDIVVITDNQLSIILPKIIRSYVSETGNRVSVSYVDYSDILSYTQNYDEHDTYVLITSNSKIYDQLLDNGFNFVGNAMSDNMVIVVAKDSPVKDVIADIGSSYTDILLQSVKYTALVIPDPANNESGKVAKKILKDIGLWQKLISNDSLVRAYNDEQAMEMVKHGRGMGMVLNNMLGFSDVCPILQIHDNFYHNIIYRSFIFNRYTKNNVREMEEFIEFVASYVEDFLM